ncbi:galactose oxidase [Rhizobiales bacterium]
MHLNIKRPLLLRLFILGFLCLCLLWSLGLLRVSPGANLKRIGFAEWQPRDSAGEFVYKGKLWILGGWKTGPVELLRDVWNSTDGVKWSLVQPKLPFDYTDLPMTIVFKDKMWVLGGNRLSDPEHPTSNAIWNSDDGIQWTKVQDAAAWSPRTATPIVEWNGELWIFGGEEVVNGKPILRNDVWRSSDGINWTKVTEHAAWQPRAFHTALAYKGKLWVIGGGSYAPDFIALNDVWSSVDGVNWTKVSDAPWHGRIWFSGVVYRDLMWIVGGWSKKTLNLDDIWYSGDGIKWTRLALAGSWRGRHEQSTYVFNDKIFVAGGHADPITNEVWELNVPSPKDEH